MRTTVIAFGRLRTPFVDDVEHYAKMLSRYTQLELIEVRDQKALERRIPANACLCTLDRSGRTFTSEEFASWLGSVRDSGRELCFVIGGPHGFAEELGRGPDLVLSFGPMTLPYQLARTVLLEQIFRAHKILAREPYHY